MRRLLTVLAVAAIAAAVAAPAAARNPGSQFTGRQEGLARGDGFTANKSLSGRLAQSDADLLARRDGKVVNVLIKFDVDPVASYQGGVQGIPATSPSTSGKTLRENGGAVANYSAYLGGKARQIRGQISRQVAGVTLGRNFLTAFGGASARIPANRAKDLLNVQGVAAVMYDNVRQPQTDATPDFIGADQVWPSLGGSQTAGEGVKVGVIDTGIWPEHPSFTDPGIDHPGGAYACDFGDSGDADDADFACNDKLIGAYAFLETQLIAEGVTTDAYCTDADNGNVAGDDCSARDSDGHGTHTSSTAAGRGLSSAVVFGIERGPISGIAPGAHVIHYRVCIAGCYDSDVLDAVAQAIVDDVDVINFSISGGADPFSDAVELAFLDAYAAGIMVNASAGNSGPGAATTDHGGPWTNTVAASTSDRHFLTTLHLTADGGATLDVSGVTITAGISSPAQVVLGKTTAAGELCDTTPAGGTYTGMIVACERGVIARVEKGFNVLQGGAAGMILYNVGVTDVETDNHYLPTVHVNDANQTIEAFVTDHTGVMAKWSSGVASAVPGDVMASFSSRGPLGDFLKPDVTAPGVQILAGASPEHLDQPEEGLGPDGELFQAIAGTSMSSPHAAGVAALVKAAHPSWTPGQIKSAMMTSSVQDVLKEDGATRANPFDRGAGSIRANRAVSPTVTFEATSADFFGASGDPLSRIHLNIASVNAPVFPGVITTERRARNMTGVTQTLNITTSSPAGAKITVSPTKLVIPPFGAKSFDVRIEGAELADGQYFGQITLNPKTNGYINAVLPVAFNKTQGDVSLDHSCDSPIAKGTEAECEVSMTNFSNTEAHVAVTVKGENKKAIKINDFSAGNKKGNGFVWNGTLSAALAPPIIELAEPGFGFLDISSGFGSLTVGPLSDDAAENWNVPSFDFGGEAYSQIGIVSNGYLVVGGAGGSEDILFNPQDMPNPAAPNNVLAPYWTDLNPPAGGTIYINVLTDGVNDFIVVQWEAIPIFGSGAARTFQVWIQTNDGPGGESIQFEYEVVGAGSTTGLNVGAENRDGTSAADLGIDVVPALTGYDVIAGSPIPGGSMTISYDALGKKVGTWPVRATMTSDVTPGTTKEVVRIEVTP